MYAKVLVPKDDEEAVEEYHKYEKKETEDDYTYKWLRVPQWRKALDDQKSDDSALRLDKNQEMLDTTADTC